MDEFQANTNPGFQSFDTGYDDYDGNASSPTSLRDLYFS